VGCGEVDHGDGVLRREEARRWGHALLDIMARTTRVKGQRGEDESVLATLPSWQYGRGRVSMMATVMVPPQAIEHVYWLAGSEGRARARGEREGSTDAMGRGSVLRRPEAC
jgi:hypothetical protein